jgi:hypothetical protein
VLGLGFNAMSEIKSKTERKLPKSAFKKGVSGNPGGRPALTGDELDLRAAARLKAPEALITIIRLMTESQNDAVQLKAAEIVLDRGYGKATQTVEMNVKREITELSDAELHAIASGARTALEEIRPQQSDRVREIH